MTKESYTFALEIHLQDIFYSIIDTDMILKGDEVYERTEVKLTENFLLWGNQTFERHVFRSIMQQHEESMAQYVTRLR